MTAVCSTQNVELVKSLGGDRVIDYTVQDFTKDTSFYDIIFDAVGKESFSGCQNILKPNGVYVTTLPDPDSVVQSFLTFLLPGKKSKLIVAQSNGQDLAYLKELIEGGKIRSVIDRTYSLEELAAAHAESEQGHVVGKLVIAVTS